jgi:hypothetical protein
VSLLLRLTALLSASWTVLLLGRKELVIGAALLSPMVCALANALGIANLVLAAVFWGAARDPAANRRTVYAAIAWLALKVASDLYDLLVLLPPSQAVVSLVDLVVSLALLVGMLEALPKILGDTHATPGVAPGNGMH